MIWSIFIDYTNQNPLLAMMITIILKKSHKSHHAQRHKLTQIITHLKQTLTQYKFDTLNSSKTPIDLMVLSCYQNK